MSEIEGIYETSSAQRRMFALDRIADGGTSYNMPFAIVIEGDLDTGRLRSALEKLLERHEAFRTGFELSGREVVQKVHRLVPLVIDEEDLDDDPARIDEAIFRFIRPFDLAEPPLVRFKIGRLGQGKHLFLVDMHHIISDGTSGYIIVEELSRLYEGQPLPELEVHYRDYAAWHNRLLETPELERQQEYWLEALQGELPVLDLPYDHPRPAVQRYTGDFVKRSLSPGRTAEIKKLCNGLRVTPSMFLLTVYALLLAKYSGQRELLVGTPIAGRFDEDHQKIIGLFVNTLVLRCAIDPEAPFEAVLEGVKTVCVNAYRNQSYPFDRVVEKLHPAKDLSRGTLFDTMFIMQNMQQKEFRMGGSTFSFYDVRTNISKFDLSLIVSETKGAYVFMLEYSSGLFRRETADAMADHLLTILDAVCLDRSVRLSGLSLLSDREAARLDELNATSHPYDRQATIHGLFEKAAAGQPESIALVAGERALSYRGLNERANRLAHTLIGLGAGGSLVGLCTGRSFEMIIGLLAILKAGAAYLPLDPEYPPQRLSDMLADSGARLLLVQGALTGAPGFEGTVLDLDSEASYAGLSGNPPPQARGSDAAYVIYTSGSTGKPKGVVVEHANVVNFCAGLEIKLGRGGSRTMLCLTTISFDIFVLETIYPLLEGFKVVIFPKSTLVETSEVRQAVERHGVTMMQLTPSRLKALLYSDDLAFLGRLGWIFVGGEALESSIAQRLRKLTLARIFNMYGPTEATVWATMKEIGDTRRITLGRPMANVRVQILDEKNLPLPPGLRGELVIGGDGVARGYLDRDDLTRERFLSDPRRPGERMYRTGDVARWNPDGEIEFFGRKDHQVKIRGYRIELGEIESLLVSIPGITEAAVVTAKLSDTEVLAAFFTGDPAVDAFEARKTLSRQLPEYMVPSRLERLSRMPHTPNGKVDRSALQKLAAEAQPPGRAPSAEAEPLVRARSDGEKILTGIWEEVLGRKDIGVHDHFFSLGGNSLLLVQLQARLETFYPGAFKVVDLFKYPSIAQMAERLSPGPGKPASGLPQGPQSGAPDARDIAIIGIAARMPQAPDKERFWDLLRAGTDLVSSFPEGRRADAEILAPRGLSTEAGDFNVGAYLDDIAAFDHGFFKIPRREACLMNPNQRLFLQTSYEALEDAGWSGRRVVGTNTGVFVGLSAENEEYARAIYEKDRESYSLSVIGNYKAITPSRISYLLDLKGPALVVDTACSSSLVAVHLACRSLMDGECDMALAGSCKIQMLPLKASAVDLGIASSDGKAKSFDDASDGTGMGEGVIVFVLKPLSRALRDRDNVYAVIKGSAINQDGASVGITAPNPAAQEAVIVRAWEKAGIDPETISYWEAHGTGTKLGDPIEIEGLEGAFRRFTRRRQFCALGSVKSNLGHLDHAAGAAGLLKAVMSLRHRELPASLHFVKPNRKIGFESSPVYVNDRLSPWRTAAAGLRRCGVSSFGLSGTNCHLVLEEFLAPARERVPARPAYLLALSAKTEAALRRLVERYQRHLRRADVEMEDLCWTACVGRAHHKHRLAVVFRTREELLDQLGSRLSLAETRFSQSEALLSGLVFFPDAPGREDPGDVEKWMETGRLYVEGAEVDWEGLYAKSAGRTAELPAYPFEPSRCWLDGAKSLDLDFHQTVWTPEEVAPPAQTPSGRRVLILKRPEQNLAALGVPDAGLVVAQFAQSFARLSRRDFAFEPSEAGFDRLFASLDAPVTDIVHLAALGDGNGEPLRDLSGEPGCGPIGLLHLSKALVKHRRVVGETNLVVLAHKAHEVAGEAVVPENAALLGTVQVIGSEFSHLRSFGLDLDSDTPVSAVLQDVWNRAAPGLAAYRRGQRHVRNLVPRTPAPGPAGFRLVAGGVYVITGGLGGLGLELARHLGRTRDVKIVLIGRSPLQGEIGGQASKSSRLDLLRQAGIDAEYLQADVADRVSMEAAFLRIRARHGRVRGVVHAAGVLRDGLMVLKKAEDFAAVLSPKVLGARNLFEILRREPPDFLILFSSISSLLGVAGQSDYTAANAFLDSFASFATRAGVPALAINWPAWMETGMAFEAGAVTLEGPILALKTAEGLAAFDTILASGLTGLIPGRLNPHPAARGQTVETPAPPRSPTMKHKPTRQEIEDGVYRSWCKVFGLTEIGPRDNFYDLGGDSILAMHLHRELDRLFPGALDIVDIFTHSSIGDMTAHLLEVPDGVEGDQGNGNLDEVLALLARGEISVDEADRRMERNARPEGGQRQDPGPELSREIRAGSGGDK